MHVDICLDTLGSFGAVSLQSGRPLMFLQKTSNNIVLIAEKVEDDLNPYWKGVSKAPKMGVKSKGVSIQCSLE